MLFTYSSYGTTHNVDYMIYQSNKGYYKVNVLYFYNVDDDNANAQVTMEQYNIETNELYNIEYRSYPNTHLFIVNYYNETEQFSYEYTPQYNYKKDTSAQSYRLSLFHQNDFVLTYQEYLNEEDLSTCTSVQLCEGYSLSQNVTYLSGWDQLLKTGAESYQFTDSQGNNILDSFEQEQSRLLQIKFNTFHVNDGSLYDEFMTLLLQQHTPITSTQFNNPVSGLNYVGPYSFTDVKNHYVTELEKASEQFKVDQSSFYIFNEKYDNDSPSTLYQLFIPKEFAEHLEKQDDFYQ